VYRWISSVKGGKDPATWKRTSVVHEMEPVLTCLNLSLLSSTLLSQVKSRLVKTVQEQVKTFFSLIK
jgi:hypothetical protein